MSKEKKIIAAKKAIEYEKEGMKIGLGTGSTADEFAKILSEKVKNGFKITCVPTSNKTKILAEELNIPLGSLSDLHLLDLTIDGADEIDNQLTLIKGGGGALTREKILAYSSDIFVCIVDESKYTDLLGKFPLPIEVIEIARSAISRELMKMGGKPIFRNGFISDNGNQIIDIHNLPIDIPYDLEAKLNNIPGVVENGIFANRKADVIICSTDSSIEIIQ